MTFKDFIHSKGHTVKTLAAVADISPRTLEQYASGRFPLKNSRAWLIVAVAKALDTTPEYLLTLDQ